MGNFIKRARASQDDDDTEANKIFRESQLVLFLRCAEIGRADMIWPLLLINQDVPMFSIDAQDADGNTALLLATIGDHQGVVYALLEFGANISLRNNKGLKAFDVARRHSYIWYSLQVLGKYRQGKKVPRRPFRRLMVLECMEQVSVSVWHFNPYGSNRTIFSCKHTGYERSHGRRLCR
jgi:hypothetical protein